MTWPAGGPGRTARPNPGRATLLQSLKNSSGRSGRMRCSQGQGVTLRGLCRTALKASDTRMQTRVCRPKDSESREPGSARLVREGVLWKTPDFRFFNEKPLAPREARAYIATSRRPDGLDRGPRNGPEADFVGSFLRFSACFGVLKKSSKKAVDGKEDWVLYPAPHRKRAAGEATTDAADDWPRRPFVCGMFDIVSGRETRAAVLLAGFSPGLRAWCKPMTTSTIAFLGKPVLRLRGVSRGFGERASRQERKCFAATSRNSAMFRRGQTST